LPSLIDELPAIAALAAHGGEVDVRGASELRVKESDRIAALVTGFRALGIDADERPDGFSVGARPAPRVRAAARPTRARSPPGDGVRHRRARRRRTVHDRRRRRGRHLVSRLFSTTLRTLVTPVDRLGAP